MSAVFIGTSGWSYNHWRGIFYPQGLQQTAWLEFYSRHFCTVEVNSTFYHLPREETVRNWVKKTPTDFLFSVKASRFITHFKQLTDPEESLKKFWQVLHWFSPKLGPVLFQFPSKFTKNLERLEKFLDVLSQKVVPGKIRTSEDHQKNAYPKNKILTSLEFRHSSWFCSEVYALLSKYNVCLCFSDTPRYPYEEEITADFVYLRLHGHERLYVSKYTQSQLSDYARKIKKWSKKVGDVYCYFDNDAYGYAVENAKELEEMVRNVKVKIVPNSK